MYSIMGTQQKQAAKPEKLHDFSFLFSRFFRLMSFLKNGSMSVRPFASSFYLNILLLVIIVGIYMYNAHRFFHPLSLLSYSRLNTYFFHSTID